VSTVSRIEWTEQTWNPTIGCTKISTGCKHCYAETMARRLQAMGTPGYEQGFKLAMLPNRLLEPTLRLKPTMYFVNSMSDLFHDSVLDEYIDRVFGVMGSAPQHTFQLLTKRATRLERFLRTRPLLPNVWIGVSVENRKYGLPRLGLLRSTRAAVRFLSIEPLLEDLGDFDLTGIDWVIVGGESGHGARPMREEWVQRIYQQCKLQRVEFFFKQWGAWGPDGIKRSKKENGRRFAGRHHNGMPKARSPELALSMA